MASWLKPDPAECGETGERVQELLNETANESREGLLLAAGPELQFHIEECRECSRAVNEALEVRQMLVRGFPPMEDPGEAFAAQVMRAIALQEAEGQSASSAWFALPALAARFAWVTAVGLLLATTWVYEVRGPGAAQNPGNDAAATSLEPGTPATQDEVLASLAVREP
jgi:hypothetical protein